MRRKIRLVLTATFWLLVVLYLVDLKLLHFGVKTNPGNSKGDLQQLAPNPASRDNLAPNPVSRDLQQVERLMLEDALHEVEDLRRNISRLQELARQAEVLKNGLQRQSSSGPLQGLSNTKEAASSLTPAELGNWRRLPTGESPSHDITIEYEKARRKAVDDVKEQWYYIRSQLTSLQASASLPSSISSIIERMRDQHISTVAHLYNMSHTPEQNHWREQESAALSALVQNRFEHLQNPRTNCSRTKRVYCNLRTACGLGCQVHHLVYCFTVAYGTGRTLVLDSRGWKYAQQGWETHFRPLSNTCTHWAGSIRQWPGSEATDVIKLPQSTSMRQRPDFLPMSIPEDLAPRLMRLHGDPGIWWIGHIIRYLMRPNAAWQEILDEKMREMDFHRPIVGVHVRRTDKIAREAKFHKLSEYMIHIEEYFDMLDKIRPTRPPKRRIYIASDDPSVHTEVKKTYPHYEVIGDRSISKSASTLRRFSLTSLQGVLIDLYALARCDYLVCTFSSNLCRAAYAEMQTIHPDASAAFHSLDDIYYFIGQHAHNRVAWQSYKARTPDEIDIQAGDAIAVAGNHWDGFSKGRNQRTGKVGLFPSYIVEDEIRVIPMPLYKEADEKLYAERLKLNRTRTVS